MTVAIYSDLELARQVEDFTLFEGQTYYADLTDYSPEDRRVIITEASLASFGSKQLKNKIWEFKIDGFVGHINFEDSQYQVISTKLGLDGSGDEQFQHLLEDIQNTLGSLTFRYGTPSSARVISDAQSLADDLRRLEYLRSHFTQNSDLRSISTLLNILYRRPNSVLRDRVEYINAGKPGRIDVRTAAKNINKLGLSPLITGNEQVGIKLAERQYAALKLPTIKKITSFDTPENRFIKFVLKDFEGLCIRIRSDHHKDARILADADGILRLVRQQLAEPLFRDVRPLTYFPSHSSVLTRDFAYAGIYEHFMRSKYGTSHLLENLEAQLRFSSLKDIATLYEIWCFAQVANATFEPDETVYIDGFNRNLNKLSNGVCWRTNNIAIYFNKTFGKHSGSYSLQLRPDIVVERTIDTKKRYWHFDAKYKVKTTSDVSGDALSGDIHKMHTYVDAIEGSVASIALYPGTANKFYPRATEVSATKLETTLKLGGVSAIGLVPAWGQDTVHAAIEIIKSNQNNI